MSARWLSNAGSSILEVLVAMVITGIAATAATGGIVSTTNLLGENTMHHEAIVVGQRSLERLRTVPYEEIESATATDGEYTLTKTVLNDTPEVGMKQIAVNVTWTWKGEYRSYILRTVFAQLTKS